MSGRSRLWLCFPAVWRPGGEWEGLPKGPMEGALGSTSEPIDRWVELAEDACYKH